MPRRSKKSVAKRAVQVDPKYGSELVAHMINYFMRKGKKTTAQRIVYGAIAELGTKVEGKDVLEVLDSAVNNMKPSVEVKSRRVGGATYQVPIEVRAERRQTLGLRWLTSYSRKRSETTMKERLAGEIMDACNGTGSSVKKREDTHKMAEANKAFSHFRW